MLPASSSQRGPRVAVEGQWPSPTNPACHQEHLAFTLPRYLVMAIQVLPPATRARPMLPITLLGARTPGPSRHGAETRQ